METCGRQGLSTVLPEYHRKEELFVCPRPRQPVYTLTLDGDVVFYSVNALVWNDTKRNSWIQYKRVNYVNRQQ